MSSLYSVARRCLEYAIAWIWHNCVAPATLGYIIAWDWNNSVAPVALQLWMTISFSSELQFVRSWTP